MGRAKRERTNKTTGEVMIIVTYRILAGDQIFPVDVLNPAEFIPLDTQVRMPVYIRCYAGKNGPAYNLTMQSAMKNGTF